MRAHSRTALRVDEKRVPLVLDLVSVLGPHTDTSLQCDALTRPVGEAVENGNLTN